ncbi:endosomal targeting BRO1-like domain-containing protein [Striga asiatica]|uniref:Endosomal targeting BRO1-like domain-containing protein n=1 Tax=Striga asiatica TaxID=4170 RepID=A0A5A7P736_STRAF|nr:endosomal targeting BRO1-like domain-containing protein [Striga asiatica]
MMISYPGLAKLKTKTVVYPNVLLASDSTTLEELKELSSLRKAIEDSINDSSNVTNAIAREMSGGLTSRYEQDIQKLANYLPLLENLVHNINAKFKNEKMVCWVSSLKIRWTSVLSSSSIFHIKGPKFHQINDINFELGMSLFLYDVVQSAALFRKAAGVYDYLAKEVHILVTRTEDRIPEAMPNISSIMSLICLADAQAVTTKKSEENGNSGRLLAKLHYGITEFLSEAIELLQATTKDCKDITSRLMDYMMTCKSLHELKSYKYIAENLKSEGKFGLAIGILQREISNDKKVAIKDESWRSVRKQVVNELSVVLRKYEHENEFVWHEKVPSKYELPWAQGVKVVSAIPYQPQKLEKILEFKLKLLGFGGRKMIRGTIRFIGLLGKNYLGLKGEGGLGFKDLRTFTEALLMKQLWRVLIKPNLLMSRVIKGRYFSKERLSEVHKSLYLLAIAWGELEHIAEHGMQIPRLVGGGNLGKSGERRTEDGAKEETIKYWMANFGDGVDGRSEEGQRSGREEHFYREEGQKSISVSASSSTSDILSLEGVAAEGENLVQQWSQTLDFEGNKKEAGLVAVRWRLLRVKEMEWMEVNCKIEDKSLLDLLQRRDPFDCYTSIVLDDILLFISADFKYNFMLDKVRCGVLFSVSREGPDCTTYIGVCLGGNVVTI